jgi:hypothetical protein
LRFIKEVCMKTNNPGRIISQAVVFFFVLFISTTVLAEALAPILTNELYTGGPGNQYGVAITSTDEALYTTITDLAAYQNRITKYSLPLSGSPAWSFQWPGGSYSEQGWLNDILVTEEGIYYAGSSYCLTTDGVGDKESKAILVKFPLDGPTGSGVGGCEWYISPHMFPYTGGESFQNMLLATEQGMKYIYIAGYGQANGGGTVATLSKYDMAGNNLWWYPLSDTAYKKDSYGAKVCNSIINGKIYVSGRTRETWTVDTGSIGYIWVRDPNGVALPTISYQEAGKGVCFNASYYDGQYLYVTGHINPGPSGGQDVLVIKYLPDGTVVWQKTWGGSNNESAQNILGKNGILYISGSTSSFGSGGDDVFLLQMASSDGAVKNQSFAGGSLVDVPLDLTISNSNLYTNGYTTSVTANGNTLGQYEAMLLSYLLPECSTPPTGDMNNDCKVNLADFAVFAENWLKCTVEPAEACLY